jgi:peptidylprolyl isomerase
VTTRSRLLCVPTSLSVRPPVLAAAAAAVLLGAAVTGCASHTAPDGTAAAPVPAPSAAALQPTVLPAVGNATNLTAEPKVGAGTGLAPTTLTVKDLVAGTGTAAGIHDTVTVNYVGIIWKTGQTFDASWTSGQPATFPLDGVIAGFSEGIGGSVSDQVAGMRAGGRRMIVIPPRLGYGPQGGQGMIKVDDTIVFVVDLLGVTPAGTTPAGTAPAGTATAPATTRASTTAGAA